MTEFYDGSPPADGGQSSLMPVTKWLHGLSGDTRRYELANIVAHLFGSRGEARNWSSAGVLHGGCVTDHKYIVEAFKREIGANNHATSAIVLGRKPLSCRRRHNA